MIDSAEAEVALILITFGGLFLIGLVADLIGRHTPFPRVTLLLLAGFLIGPAALNWLPQFTQNWFSVLTEIALAMIGFLLGQKLTRTKLRTMGYPVLAMSLGVACITTLLVFTVLSLFGVPIVVALLLAGIAPATAPAATVDVVNELQAEGPFTDSLLGIVAIDDAWGLLVFSLLLAVAQSINGIGSVADVLASGIWEIGGALVLGVALGIPMSFVTGRIRPGEPTQAEALGLVLLCAGISLKLDVSYLLATMAMGVTVANFSKHHERPFDEIKGIEWPFLILFFLIAGASLHTEELLQIGLLGIGYILLRVAGRLIGVRIGGWLSGADKRTRNWIGFALLPQAGVAIGMALLASQRFPELSNIILPVVLGSTVIFELAGPPLTRYVLIRMKEAQLD
jgi:Kef-type K+ transport system membrane component KefB